MRDKSAIGFIELIFIKISHNGIEYADLFSYYIISQYSDVSTVMVPFVGEEHESCKHHETVIDNK